MVLVHQIMNHTVQNTRNKNCLRSIRRKNYT